MTHDELAADLAAHIAGYFPAMVWQNMQMGPQGSPRPDVYAITKTYTVLAATAFEVKISVADFRRDITAGKWQAYLKYASAVVFAAPAGLLRKDDIPRGCGLIEHRESGWRFTRKPTRTPLTSLPTDAWLKLVIDGCAREGIERRVRGFSRFTADRSLAKRHGAAVARLIEEAIDAPERLKAELERHELRAAAMQEQERRERDAMRARLERDAGQVHADILELCQILGCSAAEAPQTIRGAVDLLRRSPWRADSIDLAIKSVSRAAEHLGTIQKLLRQDTEELADA